MECRGAILCARAILFAPTVQRAGEEQREEKRRKGGEGREKGGREKEKVGLGTAQNHTPYARKLKRPNHRKP